MKTKIILFLLFISFFFLGCSEERPEWRGKIEYEEGIKVIKNLSEPVYGEILLDLEEDISIGREDDKNYMFHRALNLALDSQENIFILDSGNHRIQKFDSRGRYLQTIGKRGQGPGEFENPQKLFLDDQDNIYILDSQKIKVFDRRGEFVKNILLQNNLYDFFVDSKKYIFGVANIPQENERKRAVVKMDSEGKIIKKIAEFSGVKPAMRGGKKGRLQFTVHHVYTPWPFFSPLKEQIFSYAYSLEYELFVADNKGNLLFRIQKEEKPHPISQKEKDFIIKGVGDHTSRRGPRWPDEVLEEACRFPPHRPFFRWIGVDDRQRLYVWRLKSVFERSRELEFDLFNREGYYLYRVKIPFLPYVIKKGFLYDIRTDEETGEVRIRRFRIKNWGEINDRV